MAFIQGIHINDHLPVYIGLSKIYGIGLVTAKKICSQLLIPYRLKFSQLSSSHIASLEQHLSSYTIESSLKSLETKRSKLQKSIRSYKSQ